MRVVSAAGFPCYDILSPKTLKNLLHTHGGARGKLWHGSWDKAASPCAAFWTIFVLFSNLSVFYFQQWRWATTRWISPIISSLRSPPIRSHVSNVIDLIMLSIYFEFDIFLGFFLFLFPLFFGKLHLFVSSLLRWFVSQLLLALFVFWLC